MMPLVINALGGGHTDGHTDTHTYQCADQSNFKKPSTRGQRPCAPGLKISGWANSDFKKCRGGISLTDC